MLDSRSRARGTGSTRQTSSGERREKDGVGVDTPNPITAAYRGMLPRSTLTLTVLSVIVIGLCEMRKQCITYNYIDDP